jgi:hypothetical protein
MMDLHTVFETLVLAAYLVLCAVLFQRARIEPKKYVFFAAFATIAIHQVFEVIGDLGFDTVMNDYGYVFKTIGYAVLLGVFIYITGLVKNPHKVAMTAMVCGIAYFGLLLAESFWMGVPFRTLCVLVAVILLASTILAYWKASQRTFAITLGAVGAGFTMMGILRSILYPNALLSPIFCAAVGTLFVVSGILIFYQSMRARDEPAKPLLAKPTHADRRVFPEHQKHRLEESRRDAPRRLKYKK